MEVVLKGEFASTFPHFDQILIPHFRSFPNTEMGTCKKEDNSAAFN